MNLRVEVAFVLLMILCIFNATVNVTEPLEKVLWFACALGCLVLSIQSGPDKPAGA